MRERRSRPNAGKYKRQGSLSLVRTLCFILKGTLFFFSFDWISGTFFFHLYLSIDAYPFFFLVYHMASFLFFLLGFYRM